MDVVARPSHGFGDAAGVANRASEERVKGVTPVFADNRLAILRAENDVVVKAEVSRRHDALLRPCRGARGYCKRFRGGRARAGLSLPLLSPPPPLSPPLSRR